MQNYITFAALFWLLIFSVLSYSLAHGSESAKQREAQAVVPLIILAWLGTLGVFIYDIIKSYLFG